MLIEMMTRMLLKRGSYRDGTRVSVQMFVTIYIHQPIQLYLTSLSLVSMLKLNTDVRPLLCHIAVHAIIMCYT